MSRTACVFHIHTRHSYDCIARPRKTVDWARRHGIRVLGITDHNTIAGAVEAADRARHSGVQVIIGAEYATSHGDIIGLFLTDEVRSRDAFDVIDAIRAQGGVSVLPHPYHGHRATEELARAVDVVEVFNARCSDAQNHQALELARIQNKPMLAGADAHFISELGSCICYVDATRPITPAALLSADRTWVATVSPKTGLYWSQVIKGWKSRDPALAKAHLRAVLLDYLRRTAGEWGYGQLRRAWKAGTK